MMKFSCLTPRAGTNISETLLSFYVAKLTFAALYKSYKVSKDVNVGLLSLDLNVRNVKAK